MSGCSGGCCSSAPICPCRSDQNLEIDSLPRAVACFQSLQAGLHAEQAYYASLPSLDVAVIDAVLVLNEENGLRPAYDTGLTPEQLDTLQKRLVESAEDIDSCQRFKDLFALVVGHFPTETPSATAAYDTALRIALFTGMMPDDILVHQGNRTTIEALCDTTTDDTWIKLTRLPAPLQQLAAAEAELCLSICREKICGMVDTSE